MNLSAVTHPDLLRALALCGHGSKVLIADGNFPHVTGTNRHAKRIHLNFRPGLLTGDQVLESLALTIPIEAAEFMQSESGATVPAVEGYLALLPGVPATGIERFSFYDAARSDHVAVVVATGDERAYANLLVTVGVRPPSFE